MQLGALFFLALSLLTYVKSWNFLNVSSLKNLDYSQPMPKLDPDLQKDMDLLDEVKNKTRLVSCMVLIRNNIVHGNVDIGPVMKSTKHDKSKTFDKILATMIDYCDRTIPESDINFIINPDNILNPNKTQLNFMKYDESIFSSDKPLEFSERESQILRVLAESQQPEKDDAEEEDLTEKKETTSTNDNELPEETVEVDVEPEEIIPNEVFGFDLNRLGIRTEGFTKYHYLALGGGASFLGLLLCYFIISLLFCRKAASSADSFQNNNKPQHGKKKKN